MLQNRLGSGPQVRLFWSNNTDLIELGHNPAIVCQSALFHQVYSLSSFKGECDKIEGAFCTFHPTLFKVKGKIYTNKDLDNLKCSLRFRMCVEVQSHTVDSFSLNFEAHCPATSKV